MKDIITTRDFYEYYKEVYHVGSDFCVHKRIFLCEDPTNRHYFWVLDKIFDETKRIYDENLDSNFLKFNHKTQEEAYKSAVKLMEEKINYYKNIKF